MLISQCQQKKKSSGRGWERDGDQQGVTHVNIRMYFGARKKRFQSNFWYSVSSGGPLDFFVFVFFFCSASIMPDISMSLSFLRNHIAGAVCGWPCPAGKIFGESRDQMAGGKWAKERKPVGGKLGARASLYLGQSLFFWCRRKKFRATGNSWGRGGWVWEVEGERGVGEGRCWWW